MARSPQKHLDRAAKSQNQGMWGEACEAGGLGRQRGEVEQETCLQAPMCATLWCPHPAAEGDARDERMFGGLLQVARNELVTVARNELDDILENNVMDDGPTGHESQEEQAAYPDPRDAEARECVEIPRRWWIPPPLAPQPRSSSRSCQPVAEILCWGFRYE